MMKPLVVGFLGRAGSGKSTAAQHVVDRHSATRCSFAAPLKELAKIVYEFTDEQVYGATASKETIDARWGITPRTGMIRIGDGARKTMGQRIWIDACFAKILEDAGKRALLHHPMDTPPARYVYVIDDVRYPNEAAAIRNDSRIEGTIIKLICPDSVSSSEFSDAPSEKSVDTVEDSQIDFTIVSRKSPGSEDLKRKVDAIFADLLVR